MLSKILNLNFIRNILTLVCHTDTCDFNMTLLQTDNRYKISHYVCKKVGNYVLSRKDHNFLLEMSQTTFEFMSTSKGKIF